MCSSLLWANRTGNLLWTIEAQITLTSGKVFLSWGTCRPIEKNRCYRMKILWNLYNLFSWSIKKIISYSTILHGHENRKLETLSNYIFLCIKMLLTKTLWKFEMQGIHTFALKLHGTCHLSIHIQPDIQESNESGSILYVEVALLRLSFDVF